MNCDTSADNVFLSVLLWNALVKGCGVMNSSTRGVGVNLLPITEGVVIDWEMEQTGAE